MEYTAADILQCMLSHSQLLGGQWQPEDEVFRLELGCLHHQFDGFDPVAKCVETRLHQVTSIAVAYDCADLSIRPSEFTVPPALRAMQLIPWPWRGHLICSVSCLREPFEAELCVVVDWLLGDLDAVYFE